MRYVILALVRADAISAPARARAPRRAARLPVGRHAFTLIEMLVSLAITLIMMGAVVTLFGTVTDSVSSSRALLEASDRLRACRNRLQADLQCATASMKPPLRPENGEGYLEILEGPETDGLNRFNGTSPPINTLFGDTDDALMLTVRSRGEPFVGKYNGTTIESQVAEVVYFLSRSWSPGPDGIYGNADDIRSNEASIDAIASDPLQVPPLPPPPTAPAPPLRLFTLYRRVLLVYPGGVAPPAAANFYSNYDLSVRFDTSGNTILNTLGDLTKRENRFAHLGAPPGTVYPPPFPFFARYDTTPLTSTPPNFPTSGNLLVPFSLASGRLGDDVIMTNVLSFDVQVYDPGAPLYTYNGTLVEPRDQGYRTSISSGTLTGFGAYADLGYLIGTGYSPGANPSPLFGSSPETRSGFPFARTAANPYAYDTWSWHYENDGLDQNGDGIPDAGTNGLDDDPANNNGVDDIGERDTMPPYPSPLRGIRVTIRVYEPSSQQVRQVTVVQDYLPD
ncbi:MAG TPA: prepilin-type N-terminal cleavage/methylation domain-containing protein [Pirellulales bacterium]|nr:prepilin-type N-terminal cleavage/methylation domain-containing protein [Pirellulales bacterium]